MLSNSQHFAARLDVEAIPPPGDQPAVAASTQKIRVVRCKLHGPDEATLIAGRARSPRLGSSYRTSTSRIDHPGFSNA